MTCSKAPQYFASIVKATSYLIVLVYITLDKKKIKKSTLKVLNKFKNL